mmetsp:Transcript_27856/g.65713  ORF Transcript_27856/g.65713 Transcript_27856/m.65713 type:complete len:203 (+) Transcript_27856:1696-2304(+)
MRHGHESVLVALAFLHAMSHHNQADFAVDHLSCNPVSFDMIMKLRAENSVVAFQLAAFPAFETALVPQALHFLTLRLQPEWFETWVLHCSSVVCWVGFQHVNVCQSFIALDHLGCKHPPDFVATLVAERSVDHWWFCAPLSRFLNVLQCCHCCLCGNTCPQVQYCLADFLHRSLRKANVLQRPVLDEHRLDQVPDRKSVNLC